MLFRHRFASVCLAASCASGHFHPVFHREPKLVWSKQPPTIVAEQVDRSDRSGLAAPANETDEERENVLTLRALPIPRK